MSAAQHRQQRTAEQMTVSELVDLAFDYHEDGALFSAARCLRAAADKLEARAHRKAAMLGVAPGLLP